MAKDEKWHAFRNLLFNELGITREDIRQWTKEAVESVAEKHIRNSINIPNMVGTAIGHVVLEKTSWGPSLKKDIQAEAVKQLVAKFDVTVIEKNR